MGWKIRRDGWVRFLLGVLLAGVLLWILIDANYERFREAMLTFDYRWLIPACGVYVLHLYVGAWRWWDLTRLQQLEVTFHDALALTMKGYFCSLFIPAGALGGDMARIAFLSARTPKGSRFEGAFSVLVDRFAGMVGMLLLVMATIVLQRDLLLNLTIPGIPLSREVKESILGLTLLGCVLGIALPVLLLFQNALARFAWGTRYYAWLNQLTRGFSGRLAAALECYREHPMVLLKWVLLSIVLGHFLTIGSVFCLLPGLREEHVALGAVFAAVCIGNVMGLAPTFSGIGVRDLTIMALLQAGGVRETAALPLLYSLVIVLCNTFSGIYFLPGLRERSVAAETRDGMTE